MRFKKWPQLPGAGRTRAGHHHGSHTPTSPEAVLLHKQANLGKHFEPECTPFFSHITHILSIWKKYAAKYFTQNPQIEPSSFSHENSTLQDFIKMILLRSTMKHQPSMKRSKNRSVKRDRKKALSVNKVPTLMWFHAWNPQFWYTVKLWTAAHLI